MSSSQVNNLKYVKNPCVIITGVTIYDDLQISFNMFDIDLLHHTLKNKYCYHNIIKVINTINNKPIGNVNIIKYWKISFLSFLGSLVYLINPLKFKQMKTDTMIF